MLWGGKPAVIIKAAENNKIVIFASEQIIEEISQVLTYPKLRSVYKAEGLRSQDLIENVLTIAKFVDITQEIKVKEHPTDDKFIECAFAAGAAYIVSGDKHLLKVACYKKTKIVSVNDFLRVLEAKK